MLPLSVFPQIVLSSCNLFMEDSLKIFAQTIKIILILKSSRPLLFALCFLKIIFLIHRQKRELEHTKHSNMLQPSDNSGEQRALRCTEEHGEA